MLLLQTAVQTALFFQATVTRTDWEIGDPGRYRMAIEEEDICNREI
jgi:hypothetical protein